MFLASFVGDEPVGHRMLLVQQPNHLSLSDEKNRALFGRRCAPHPDRLTRQTASPKKSPWPSIAITASRQVSDSTESLTAPD
jgi:hypothetical protein